MLLTLVTPTDNPWNLYSAVNAPTQSILKLKSSINLIEKTLCLADSIPIDIVTRS